MNKILYAYLILTTSLLIAGDNILLNPGFENTWLSNHYKTGKEFDGRTTKEKHSGRFSFHIPEFSQLFSQSFKFKKDDLKNSQIIVSGYYKGNTHNLWPQIRFFKYESYLKPEIAFINGLGKQVGKLWTLKPAKDWTFFKAELDIPNSIFKEKQYSFRLYFVTFDKTELYLDDLSLVLKKIKSVGNINEKLTSFNHIILEEPKTIDPKIYQYPSDSKIPKITFKNGIVYRNDKPHFLFGSNTFPGSQWASSNMWVPNILNFDYVDFMMSFSRSLNLREKDKKLHIKWNDLSWTGSIIRELARNGISAWTDLGTNQYKYNGSLIKQEKAFPGLKKVFKKGSHFYPFDHNNKLGRKFYSNLWKANKRYFKDIPNLALESFNELGYNPDFFATRKAFQDFAIKKYKTLSKANTVWHTNFKIISDILAPHLWDDTLSEMEMIEYRKLQSKKYWQMYNDYLIFLRQYFVLGFSKMKKESKKNWDTPFTLDNRYERGTNDLYASTDPEQVADIADVMAFHVTGWQFYNYLGQVAPSATVMKSLICPMLYLDYMRTAVNKTIISSECIFRYASQPGIQEKYIIDNSLVKLHKMWKFKTDKNNKGIDKGYFKTNYNDKNWEDITVPGMWEDLLKKYKTYDGVAWYRTKFKMPKHLEINYKDGTRRYLIVGKGLDDAGTVYVNGKKVFECGGGGWDLKYHIDVSDILNYGGENTIAIRINDTMLGGGIRFYITLISDDMFNERKELNKDQLSALYWSHAIHGASGVTSWFWGDAMQTWLPELQNTINSVGSILLPRPRIHGDVGLLYSWENFKGFLTGRAKKYNDVMEYIGSLAFNPIPFDILSNKVFLNIPNNRYKMIIIPYAKVLKKGSFNKLKGYVENGGVGILTYDSVLFEDDLYQKTPLEELLGVQFGTYVKDDKEITFGTQKIKIEKGQYTNKKGIYIKNINANVLATYTNGSPAIISRKVGDGQIYFIAAEIPFKAIHTILKDIMQENNINSPIKIKSENIKEFPYIEVQKIGNKKQFLLYLVNWGGQKHPLTIKLSKRYLDGGKYRIRDIQNEKSPFNDKILSSQELQNGFKIDINVQMPKVLLFESTENKQKVTLSKISPEREKILSKLESMKKNINTKNKEKALFIRPILDPEQGGYFGKLSNPIMVQLLKQNGYRVDGIDYRKLNFEKLKEYKIFILVADGKLGLKPLLNDKVFIQNIQKYVENGGSLLIAGSASVNYNANNKLIRKVLTKYDIQTYNFWEKGFCKNPKSSIHGDPLQLTVKTFKKHPLTYKVKELQFFACGAFKTSKKFTPIAFSESNDLNHPNAPIIMAGEVKKGRILVIAENSWLQPFRIELADNAQFVMNTISWLGHKKTKEIDKPSLIKSLFISTQIMQKIKQDEN